MEWRLWVFWVVENGSWSGPSPVFYSCLHKYVRQGLILNVITFINIEIPVQIGQLNLSFSQLRNVFKHTTYDILYFWRQELLAHNNTQMVFTFRVQIHKIPSVCTQGSVVCWACLHHFSLLYFLVSSWVGKDTLHHCSLEAWLPQEVLSSGQLRRHAYFGTLSDLMQKS